MKRSKNKQLSYWVKNQRRFYRQFLQDEHTPPTPERNSSLEKLDLSGLLKRGVQVKGPSARKN